MRNERSESPAGLERNALADWPIKRFDQRFSHGIALRKQLQNALLIQWRQLSILPPFQ